MGHVDNQQATPSEAEIAWLAGIIEGEGSLGLNASKRKDRSSVKIHVVVRIYNTDAGIISKCVEILKGLNVGHYIQERNLGPTLKINGKDYKARDPILEIQVKKFQDAYILLQKIRPWMFGDKHLRASLMLQFLERRLERINKFQGNTRIPYNKGDLAPVKKFYELTQVKRNRELERVLND